MLLTQSWLILWSPMDSSQSGSSAHGILQARILQWVTIPFSRGSSWCRDWTPVSYIASRFFIIWTTREALYLKSTNLNVNLIWKNIFLETSIDLYLIKYLWTMSRSNWHVKFMTTYAMGLITHRIFIPGILPKVGWFFIFHILNCKYFHLEAFADHDSVIMTWSTFYDQFLNKNINKRVNK